MPQAGILLHNRFRTRGDNMAMGTLMMSSQMTRSLTSRCACVCSQSLIKLVLTGHSQGGCHGHVTHQDLVALYERLDQSVQSGFSKIARSINNAMTERNKSAMPSD